MLNKSKFAKLLEPGYIGRVNIRNRMVKPGAGSSFIEKDGTVGQPMKDFYESVAKGGVGLIIVESCGVEYPLGTHHLSVQLHLEDDKYIPGYRELTAVIHKHACPTFLQLFHSGPWHPSWITGLTPVAASDLTPAELEELGPEKLRGLTVREVPEMVQKFAKAAERARESGFDGVEINANSSHLIDTFLSRVWNRRQDEYGPQQFASRAKFLTEIIQAVKTRCGQDFAISVLITGLEIGIKNGITLDEALQIGKLVQAAGADALQIRGFGYNDARIIHPGPERLLFPEPPRDLVKELDWSRHGAGAFVPLAAALKKVVTIPVIAVGRLGPELGEKVLAAGQADFIGLHRRLLSDPELPNKVASGQLEDIAPCTACYYCWNERVNNRYIRCRINASLGREREYALKPAEKKKQVLVIGGGPAGMEAARVAALRGHTVTLYDTQPRLGGSLALAGLVKGFDIENMLEVVQYLSRQINRLGVKVRLGQTVAPPLVQALKPDVVILATGGLPVVPPITGMDNPRVIKSEDLHRRLKFFLNIFSPPVLRRLTKIWMPVGKSVVVIGGGINGCQLAEFLVTRGRRVTIVETAETLGEGLVPPDTRDKLLSWLAEKGVVSLTGVRYESITAAGLNIITKEGQKKTLGAESIIPALPLAPDPELADSLAKLCPEVYQVGDCREPRLTAEAVADGARIGHQI